MSLPWSSKGTKGTPIAADELMIIDSADANPSTQNKRITIGTLPDIEVTTWTANHDAAGFNLLRVGEITINNPADSFAYTLTPAAITADRILNLPLMTGTDTLVVQSLLQTLSNKRFNNTNEFEDDGLLIQNPADTFNYIFQSAAIAADRTINFPLLLANDTMVTEAFTQTLTNKTIDDFSNSVHADTVHIQVRNESGGPLAQGDVVYISGFSVANDLPLVGLADASSSATMPAVGIITSAILDNANGDVTISGELTGPSTTGFTVNEPFYVSETTGEYTETKPTGTALIQNIGTTLKVGGVGVGVINVVSLARSNDLPNIPSAQFWVGNASGVPTAVTMSGDASMDNTGAVTIVTGGEFFGPWTANHDAGGFDLNDLSNIEFRNTTGAPAGTIKAIYGTTEGVFANTPSGGRFEIKVNDGAEYRFDVTTFDLLGNAVRNVNFFESDAATVPSSGTVRLGNTQDIRWRDFAGIADNRFLFNASNEFSMEINGFGAEEYTFSATEADFKGNNITTVGTLNFSPAGSILGGGAPALIFNISTAGKHQMNVNSVEEYNFSATVADFFGNTLTNVSSYESNAANIGTNGAIRLGNDEWIAWRNSGNTTNLRVGVNISDELEFQGFNTWNNAGGGFAIEAAGTKILDLGVGGIVPNVVLDMNANNIIDYGFLESNAANPATAGTIRLGNTELIEWRNAANNDNGTLVLNSSNEFLLTPPGATTLRWGSPGLNLNGLPELNVLNIQQSGTQATVGFIRMQNAETLGWRNAVNTNNLSVGFDAADDFVITMDAVVEYTFSSTLLDVKNNAIDNVNTITFLGSAADGGTVRLANTAGISWRNAGNTANLTLQANSSDEFDFGSATISKVSNLLLNSDTTHLLDFTKDTPQADDYVIGEIRFRHDDTGAILVNYGRITGVMEDDLANLEDGSLKFYTQQSGVEELQMIIDGSANKTSFSQNLDIPNGQFIFWGGVTTRGISNDTSGFQFDVETGDTFDFKINTASEYTFSSTALTFSDANDIVVGTTTGTKIGTGTTQKIGFWNVTPVVQGAALTAQETTITFVEPGTPDFAIQTLTSTTPFGFVTQDEGNTFVGVVENLQVRVAELEARLDSTTGVGLVAG